VLENVEIVLRQYDRSGREGAREGRRKRGKGMAEKRKRSHLVFGLRGAVGGLVKRTPLPLD
jgi:hypothetical protein